MEGNEDYVRTVGFTPGGKSLITGGKPIKFWNPVTGKEQQKQAQQIESAVRPPVSLDGKKLAAALHYAPPGFDSGRGFGEVSSANPIPMRASAPNVQFHGTD